MTYHLAVDLGASSGRHILGWIEEGVLKTREIYRFQNGAKEVAGSLCWDTDYLLEQILKGLEACRTAGCIPATMAIDTWGVDFVLLDGDGQRLGQAVCYRDDRTDGVPEQVYEVVPEAELYARTGIGRQKYNTIFQLWAVRTQQPDLWARARRFLMAPDYLVYGLTGACNNEYTEASTTGLLDAEKGEWDWELLDRLSIPRSLFTPVAAPGTVAGSLRPEWRERLGFDVKVVLAASHDTASAVMAVPSKSEDTLYISSGTWSLMGIEKPGPLCTEECRADGFSNEGGFGGRIRLLKNIMGLWMVQSVRRQTGGVYSFDDLCGMARAASIPSVVDVCDDRFLAPADMAAEVAAACADSGQPVPKTLGETMAVIYQSLAAAYAETARQMEKMTGRHYPCIHIIGGGSQDAYLNELTARAAGRPVVAGPTEATAIGNLLAQLIAAGEVADLSEARDLVARSFAVTEIGG